MKGDCIVDQLGPVLRTSLLSHTLQIIFHSAHPAVRHLIEEMLLYLVSFREEHLTTHKSMGNGLRIDKSPVASYLLESSYIMQHAQKPCQILILLREVQRHRNLVCDLSHMVGMLDLQRNLRIR